MSPLSRSTQPKGGSRQGRRALRKVTTKVRRTFPTASPLDLKRPLHQPAHSSATGERIALTCVLVQKPPSLSSTAPIHPWTVIETAFRVSGSGANGAHDLTNRSSRDRFAARLTRYRVPPRRAATRPGLTQVLGLTPHIMQTFEIWQPTREAPDFLFGAWVLHLGTNHMRVVCDAHFGNDKCPVFAFGPVEAIRITNDALPAWDPALNATRPLGKPFLKIVNSIWANGVRDYGEPLSHYCIISADCSVELLSEREPELRWVRASEIDALFEAGLKLGEA